MRKQGRLIHRDRKQEQARAMVYPSNFHVCRQRGMRALVDPQGQPTGDFSEDELARLQAKVEGWVVGHVCSVTSASEPPLEAVE